MADIVNNPVMQTRVLNLEPKKNKTYNNLLSSVIPENKKPEKDISDNNED